jgi:hypothetical protein
MSWEAIGQIKIGKNSRVLNPNAIFEMDIDTMGMLLPRVALTATNSFLPLKAHVAGMVVYNTATAGTAPNNVTPGFYYNDGINWIKLDKSQLQTTNGLSLYNDSVGLGGTLNRATTINMTNPKDSLTIATGGNKFKITQLPFGTAADSILLVTDPNTGQIKMGRIPSVTNGFLMKKVKLSSNLLQFIADPDIPSDTIPMVINYEDSLGTIISATLLDRQPTVGFTVKFASNPSAGYLSYGYPYPGFLVGTGPQGPPGPDVVSHTLTGNSNRIASTVNGVTATLTPPQGQVVPEKVLGFNDVGDLVIGNNFNGIVMKKVPLASANNQIVIDPNTPAIDIPIVASYENLDGKIINVNIVERTPGVSFKVNAASRTTQGFLNYSFPAKNLAIATGPQGPPGPPPTITNQLTGANNKITSTVSGVAADFIPNSNAIKGGKALGFDTSGNLVVGPTMYEQASFMYMPSISIPTSQLLTNQVLDIHAVYRSQFQSPAYKNPSAPASLPLFSDPRKFNYYVTVFDNRTIRINSLSDDGVMNYDIISNGSECSFMNIIMQIKQ